MLKKIPENNVNVGLLVLRIGVGAIFIFAGWAKVSNLSGTVAMFAGMGFNAFWTYVASFAELIGGLAVLLGVFTRLFAGILAIVMVVAIYKLSGNMEMIMTPVAVFFSCLALTLASGGKYSLKHLKA